MNELEKDVVLKFIKVDEKLPKGWSYLSSWHCEYLLCNNSKAFKILEKESYYKLINGVKQVKYFWFYNRGAFLNDFDLNSDFLAYSRLVGNCSRRLRGVLICKKK